MKMSILSLFIVCTIIFLQTGCERHPASQTVPGYAEKKYQLEKKEQEKASEPLETNPHPPQFFPDKSE